MTFRKLCAVMFTDISGYSTIMSSNETKALELLHDHDRILKKIVVKYDGKIIKKMGDAIFASYNSTLDSYLAAEEIQKAFKDYNQEKSKDERILLRIGLHAGDVVEENGDLFGDGVNIAARLEPLAEPGGICLSEAVFLSLRSNIQINGEKVEDVELKNIDQRLTIYRIPSVYGKEFQSSALISGKGRSLLNYKIDHIKKLPSGSNTLLEIAAIAFACAILFNVFGAVIISLASQEIIWNVFFFLPNPVFIFLFYNIILVLGIIFIFYVKTIRVSFRDVRDVDRVLQWVMDEVGFISVNSDKNVLIFKPNRYNQFFYMARKMKVSVDGNSVIIKGTGIVVNKLEKIFRAYEK